jgi:single-stranded DNA-binding protein
MSFNTTVNRVFLMGKISDRPVWENIGQKKTLCFTLITEEEIRKGSNPLIHTEYHHVRVPAEIASGESLQKGMLIYIQGKIQTRIVFEDGVKLYRAEIWAHSVQEQYLRDQDEYMEPLAIDPGRGYRHNIGK